MPERILFANYAVANCGVHQYGKRLFDALSASTRFDFAYAGIDSLASLDSAMAERSFAALIVNYHPQTLPFIQVDMPRRYGPPCVGVMHEMTQAEADRMPRCFFQYYTMGDPTLRESDYVFATGRIVPAYHNRHPLPALPTIGSFGFSVGSKGYQRLVDVVQEEFDQALIRINVPPNGIIDPQGILARQQMDACRARLWKPGVRLEVSHRFLTDDQLIEFLAGNSLNAFLYDYLAEAGISSTPDHALTARRPIAVTRSVMFRHLHGLHPAVTIEDTSLQDIIRNGTGPFEHLLEQWSPESIRARYESILDGILGTPVLSTPPAPLAMTPSGLHKGLRFAGRAAGAVHRRIVKRALASCTFSAKAVLASLLRAARRPLPGHGRYNRILDDWARIEHAATIRRLQELVPEVMAGKISRANVQQAFVFDAVRIFASQWARPRILAVGSFQDSAAAALKKAGFPVEEIDPAVNQLDLNTFFNRPGTDRGSYDIVFSTSVIEHVKDDGRFMEQIGALLAPGGIGVLTCDFMPGYRLGDPVIAGDFRFYTEEDLSHRLVARLRDCDLVDAPRWQDSKPDFELGGFNYSFATLVFRKREQAAAAWNRLSAPEQARFFSDNGYLVVPSALSGDEVMQAIREIGQHGLAGTTEKIWEAPFARKLVTNEKVLTALHAIFGAEIRFFKGAYVATPPARRAGTGRRKALHVDYGIGEPEGDFRNSAASWVNVAFYLTDLSADHAPLWVVPGSNRDYSVVPASDLERRNLSAKMVLAKAGDAVLFHSNTVHSASDNASEETRHAFFYSYRPAWAKPAGTVPEWPPDFIESFPEQHRLLLRDLNSGL